MILSIKPYLRLVYYLLKLEKLNVTMIKKLLNEKKINLDMSDE